MPDQSARRLITAQDVYRIATIEDPRVSPDGRWIAYVQVTPDKMDNSYQRTIWVAPTDGGKPSQLTRGGKDSQPRWSPDGRWLAFTSTRNEKPQVYLLPFGEPGGEARQLTRMPNGANSPAWSPDGRMIAFLAGMNAEERAKEDRGEQEEPPADKFEAKQRDERKKHDEERRWDPRPAWRIPYRTGTAFLDDRYAQVYVMPVAEGLKEDEAKPRRLTNVDAHYEEPAWTPDGLYILTARPTQPDSDEPWRTSGLYRIRVEDGLEEELTRRTHADHLPKPSPDGKWIAYLRVPRERLYSRMMRLAILPAAGGEPRDLTLEMDRTPVDFRWTADSSALIFNANSEGNSEIYRVALSDGSIEKIISGRMQVEALDVTQDGGVAFTASTPADPSELYWRSGGADGPLQMTEANKALLDEVIVQPVHEMWFKSADGWDIQGWYILPVGYEEGKTYPLILNIHGGPHVMWGPSTRSMWHEWQFHAAQGYVVFYCNPRGGDGYGESFQTALYNGWGKADFPDLMAGIDALLEKGFVDPKRMAVTGGSYGGFMTAWVVGHTDRFAAAFAQRGVYNLVSFYGTTDIPSLVTDEMGVEPWEDPQKLWECSPVAYAHQIKTPLIVKHSENDYRVPIEQGEQLFALVRRSGGTVKMLRYPREGHELSRSGEPEHRISRLKEMIEWFDRYCK
jgi:dipeptidyl aminopeptidase/acylaminoacyl peptidase